MVYICLWRRNDWYGMLCLLWYVCGGEMTVLWYVIGKRNDSI